MAYIPQAPDISGLLRQLTREFPVEWAEAYEFDGHPRTDRFVKIAAVRAHALDSRFGLNGKRGSDVLSLDVLGYLNPTVPDICGGVELRDFIFDTGRPGLTGRHEIVWNDATILPGDRPELPNGVLGKWIRPGAAGSVDPTDPGEPEDTLTPRIVALEVAVAALTARVDALPTEPPPLDRAAVTALVEAILAGYEVAGSTSRWIGHAHAVKLGLTKRKP